MKTKYRKLDAPDPSLKVFPKFASSFFFPKLKAEKEMIKVKLPSFNISKRLLREKSGTYRVSSFPSCFRSRCGAERSGSFLDPTSRSQWTYLRDIVTIENVWYTHLIEVLHDTGDFRNEDSKTWGNCFCCCCLVLMENGQLGLSVTE